jgi:hypothetical protein
MAALMAADSASWWAVQRGVRWAAAMDGYWEWLKELSMADL